MYSLETIINFRGEIVILKVELLNQESLSLFVCICALISEIRNLQTHCRSN